MPDGVTDPDGLFDGVADAEPLELAVMEPLELSLGVWEALPVSEGVPVADLVTVNGGVSVALADLLRDAVTVRDADMVRLPVLLLVVVAVIEGLVWSLRAPNGASCTAVSLDPALELCNVPSGAPCMSSIASCDVCAQEFCGASPPLAPIRDNTPRLTRARNLASIITSALPSFLKESLAIAEDADAEKC